MTITYREPLLTALDERTLAFTIEAGVLASALLDGAEPDARPAATDAELRALAEEGGRAWRRFVGANLRLVSMISGPVAVRAGLDPDELFQEGVVGLMEALRRFDCERGARFATFALPWIRMRVTDAAWTRLGGLGLPPSRARAWVRVVATRDALAFRLGRAPSLAEVAEAAERPVDLVHDLLSYSPPTPLDRAELVREPSEPRLGTAGVVLDLTCRRMMRCLSQVERDVIVRRFGFAGFSPMTCAEAADNLGVSQSTVRRREQQALDRLRRREALEAA